MMLYACQNQDIFVNLDHLECLTIASCKEEFEVRGHTGDSSSGFYVLEVFSDREEALKFIEFLNKEIQDDN